MSGNTIRLPKKTYKPTLLPGYGDIKKGISTHPYNHNSEKSEVPPIVHEVLQSIGQPLDQETRSYMEPRFGHDFSHVRVHTDAKSAESARAVNALAYTVGNDIVMGAGWHSPWTDSGRLLLAHELTHTVQQDMNPQIANKRLDIEPSDSSSEFEANRISNTIMAGGTNATISSSLPILARQANGIPAQPVPVAGMSAGTPSTPTTIKVWVNAFIPMATVTDPLGRCFTGDSRSFSNFIHASSRCHQEIEVNVGTLVKTIDWKHMGTTHKIDCATGRVLASATAPVSELSNGPVTRTGSTIAVHFNASASNPLASVTLPATPIVPFPIRVAPPSIDLDLTLNVDPVTRRCTISGAHDGFPAYEAYVTADGGAGTRIYSYDPVAAGETPTALFPPMDKSASGSVTF